MQYSIWTSWSAHALMSQYLEQGAVYSAMNFSHGPTVQVDDSTFIVGPNNPTVLNMKVSTFMCPSDPNVGNQNINSYAASYGATTTTLYNWTNDPASGCWSPEPPTGLRLIGPLHL